MHDKIQMLLHDFKLRRKTQIEVNLCIEVYF